MVRLGHIAVVVAIGCALFNGTYVPWIIGGCAIMIAFFQRFTIQRKN